MPLCHCSSSYFISKMYYFFGVCFLSLDTIFRIFWHRVLHFMLRAFYSSGIIRLPVTVFNVPDVDTAATGKGSDILLSYDVRTYLYIPIIRIVSTYKMRRRVDLYCVENNKIIPRSAILDGYTSVGAWAHITQYPILNTYNMSINAFIILLYIIVVSYKPSCDKMWK